MANKKISQLTDGTSFQTGDEAVVNRGGTNYKVDPTQFGSSIDVTGTVTTDGLTVEGTSTVTTFPNSDFTIDIKNNGGNGTYFGTDYYVGSAKIATIQAQYAGFLGNPTGSLHFGTRANNSADIFQRMSITQSGDISFYEDTGSTPKFFWDASAESLGIGTSSPGARLEVSDTSAAAATALVQLTGQNNYELNIQSVTTTNSTVGARYNFIVNSSNGEFSWSNSGGERLRIDSSGNIIHTGGSNGYIQASGTDNAYLRVSGASVNEKHLDFYSGATKQFEIYLDGSQNFIFRASPSSERMRITSAGNVGIGTTSPGEKLEVNGNIIADGVYLGGTGAANLLDDYEEGTWTPSIGGTATYTAQTGTYVKIGRMVFIQATIVVNTIGTGSQTTVTGIPFNCAASTNFGGSTYYIGSIATNVVHISPFIDATVNNIRFRTLTAAGATFGTANVFQNGARVDFNIVYETA